jgi:nucleotide-binding universal stress UspA family protein
MFPFKKILSPIDFSDASQKALEVAAQMAARFEAELWLVYVVPEIPKLPSASAVFKEHEYEEQLHADAARTLQTMADKLSKQGLKVKTEVGTANDAAMEIVRIAEENGIDLIVIASHGMSGWQKLVFGSVTEKVVRVAQCPVLILRAQAAAAAA